MRIIATAAVFGATIAVGLAQAPTDPARIAGELMLLGREDGEFNQRMRAAVPRMQYYAGQFDWARRAELCGMRSRRWREAAFRALQRDETSHVTRIVADSGLPLPVILAFIHGARSEAFNMSAGGDWTATCQHRSRISAAAAMLDGLYELDPSQ